MTCRKRMNDVKTGVESLPRDQRWGDPLTASAASGIKVARVRFRLEHGTWEPVASMPREKPKWRTHKGLSTDAGHRGGWARSSVEVPVMGMERRGPITQLRRRVNPAMGRNPTGKRDQWSGDKSRMRRESHVRFREGLGVKFPRATRLVICCRGTADEAMATMRRMMSKLRLTVNETKTRLCHVPEETFDFLGYTIGRCYSPQTGRPFIGTRPSAKKIANLRDEIREWTDRRWLWTEIEDRVARLNRLLLGWSNYFCLGPVSRAYRAIDRHGRHRLRQWLCAKHKVKSRGTSRFPDQYLNDKLGLLRLSARTKSFPWAKV
jgi:Group II intron, maturase-specific domain